MKPIIYILLCIVGYQQVNAQREILVKATVSKAIIYLKGAQVTSQANIQIPAGNSVIRFEGVAPGLDPSTIQTGGKGNITVTETRFSNRFIENPKIISPNKKYAEQLEWVNDSIDEYNLRLTDISNRNTTLELEKKMLLGNRIINNQTQKDSLQLLKEGMTFLREKYNNIQSEQLKLEREKRSVMKVVKKLQQRQQDLTLLINGQSTDVTVAESVNSVDVYVFAEQASPVQLNISYFVNTAGWTPFYEMHGSSSSDEIRFRQMASVYQTTGINWNDASITLSSSMPSGYTIKPDLTPWYIGAMQTKALKKTPPPSMLRSQKSGAGTDDVQEDARASVYDNEIQTADQYTEVDMNMTHVEYELKTKMNIPGNGEIHYLPVTSKMIKASYFYAVVPKLNVNAFLMARITGWENLDIIPGSAKIYFDGNFAGNTTILPLQTDDTLLLNMGRDRSLVIQRTKLKDESREKFIHDEYIKTIAFRISIKNTRQIPVYVTLEDQLPVTVPGQTQIKIDPISLNGGKLNSMTGIVTWTFKIGAKETKKTDFIFQVKAPKSEYLSGL